MNTVELFCGTKSFSKVAAKLAHETFTVDIEDKFHPNLTADILELQRDNLPLKIDVLWCSPPCQTFSVAALRHYWINGKPKNHKTWKGICFVLKTLDLISEIKKDNPDLIWFIENPRGMLRKQSFMSNLPRKTITYCQYGDSRQKPTDIWTNLFWCPKSPCSPRASCHNSAPRGSASGTQAISTKEEKSMIPEDLFYEIFKVIKRE